jgi:protoporphyrinogen oxidase
MEKFKYIILGAGPTGLSFARSLQLLGEDSFLVLEKEKEPGGSCRSSDTPYGKADIGGGHMWCTKFKEVDKFVKKHLPENEWVTHHRKTTVMFMGNEIGYPIEEHIWQLPQNLAEMVFLSVMDARMKHSSPRNFDEFIISKFGNMIAKSYMIPYNSKLWGEPLSRMSLSWLHKIPPADVMQVIRSVIRREGNSDTLFHRTWQYPKRGGFQYIFDKIAEPISEYISYGEAVKNIEFTNSGGIINGTYKGTNIINTLPWPNLVDVCNAPFWIKKRMRRLEYTSLNISLIPPTDRSSDTQWTYYPDSELPHHRTFFTSKWMPGAKFDFTETNANRPIEKKNCLSHFLCQHAYPVYTLNRDRDIKAIISWGTKKGVISLGRWGCWDYMNSDVCMIQSMEVVGQLLKKTPSDIANLA